MFPFISPFFPNIVTSFFFKVRVRTISIVNAHSRVGCNRVAIASYPKFGTLAIAHPPAASSPEERGVRAMSLRLSRSLVLPHRSCRYVTHQGGRASEGCERWSLRMLSSLVLPHSLRHASDVTCLLWHGTFGILWRILYFLIWFNGFYVYTLG